MLYGRKGDKPNFFIFAVFSTLTRPGLPGVKSPSGGRRGAAGQRPPRPAGEAGRTAQASVRCKIFLKNIKKTLDKKALDGQGQQASRKR